MSNNFCVPKKKCLEKYVRLKRHWYRVRVCPGWYTPIHLTYLTVIYTWYIVQKLPHFWAMHQSLALLIYFRYKFIRPSTSVYEVGILNCDELTGREKMKRLSINILLPFIYKGRVEVVPLNQMGIKNAIRSGI